MNGLFHHPLVVKVGHSKRMPRKRPLFGSVCRMLILEPVVDPIQAADLLNMALCLPLHGPRKVTFAVVS